MKPTNKKDDYKNKIISVIEKFFETRFIKATAKATKFVQRERKLTAEVFFIVCVFGQIKEAAQSLNDYCLEALKEDIEIVKQSFNDRFNEFAVEFMKSMVAHALSIKLRLGRIELNDKFGRIIIGDSTVFQLPETFAKAYRGCGGGASESIIKIQYAFDLLGTEIIETTVEEGICPDNKHRIKDIRKNDLIIQDLGFFCIPYFIEIEKAEAYFLSRLKFGINIYVLKDGEYESIDLLEVIRRMPIGFIKRIDVYIGKQEKYPVRLVLEKVTPELAAAKRRKLKTDKQNKRKGITKERLVFCDVNAYITNCDEERLPSALIRQCYSLRWQIEIIFKAWKSFFKIDNVKQMKLERFQCLLYGSLMLIIASTQLLMYYKWKYIDKFKKEVSELKFFKMIVSLSEDLKMVIKNYNQEIFKFMEQMDKIVERFCFKEQKKNKLKPLIILTNLTLN